MNFLKTLSSKKTFKSIGSVSKRNKFSNSGKIIITNIIKESRMKKGKMSGTFN